MAIDLDSTRAALAKLLPFRRRVRPGAPASFGPFLDGEFQRIDTATADIVAALKTLDPALAYLAGLEEGGGGGTPVPGPAGPKGDTGATGAASTVPGPAGPAGPQGLKGEPGSGGSPQVPLWFIPPVPSSGASATVSIGKGSHFAPIDAGTISGIGIYLDSAIGLSYRAAVVRLDASNTILEVLSLSAIISAPKAGGQFLRFSVTPTPFAAGGLYGLMVLRTDTTDATGTRSWYSTSSVFWPNIATATLTYGLRFANLNVGTRCDVYATAYLAGFYGTPA